MARFTHCLMLSGAAFLLATTAPGTFQQRALASPAVEHELVTSTPQPEDASSVPATTAPARPLKLATWNMEWLMAEDGRLTATAPPDRPHRTAADFEKLAAYAQHLDADLVGLQEVDATATAERIFPARTYQIFMTDDALLQHPALAVRKPLRAHKNPDLVELDVAPTTAAHQLRRGLDVTVETGTTPLRILVLHLKTGCWDNPVTEKQHNCPILLQQFGVLQNWISARAAAHEAFVIMGDFNRRMTVYDPFFLLLNHTAPLSLTTAGWASPCENGSSFIDHILLGGAAQSWLQPHSLRVMTYRPDTQPATLSDHCAVSVRLGPQAPSPSSARAPTTPTPDTQP
ncbi:endonuclease/exonuclease/phosphatase family protein [Acetobacter malorum]|uniref:endonuclease/exonuclease/phosphatase family protein n=1 Tax=Acetobacter malorum TaxID=178901 RepID=UPI0039E84519